VKTTGIRSATVTLALAALLAVLISIPAGAVEVQGRPGAADRLPSPLSPSSKDAEADTRIPGHYIVVFKDSVDHPGSLAEAQTEQRDGELGFVYRSALKGYSAELSSRAVEALRNDPRVAYVQPDRKVEGFAQTIPAGIDRIYDTGNPAADIDETDDVRVDADIAVIDSGVDYTHPDLNVVARTDCIISEAGCVDGSGVDKVGHGTHVAGTAAALDNGVGVVGVAPGARVWAVKVLNDENEGIDSTIVAGIDWVTAHASEIEVANMSLGGTEQSPAEDKAIKTSVEAGVVYVVAAGNSNVDANGISPANNPEVITVSALSDYDGLPGGSGSQQQGCDNHSLGRDDSLANYSNWGSAVDIAAPGSCIYSTLPVEGSVFGSNYRMISGTSMAAPHVTGAAAILASESNPNSKQDVEAIRQKLIEEGSLDWEDDSGDGEHEPLLDLRPPTVEAFTTAASELGTYSATLNGFVSAGGLASTYRFEYGTSTAYGTSTPSVAESIGAGVEDLERSEAIEVKPDTTYHYRVSVTNGEGTIYGEDRTFKTSQWSTQTAPSPSGAEGSSGKLLSVSCTSSTSCMAVGRKNDQYGSLRPFAERWDGTAWSIVAAPNPSGESELQDVSCASAGSCMAVGWLQEGTTRKALTARWNGSSWSIVSTPTPSGAKGPVELRGVSCASASSCMAVGRYYSDANFNPSKQETKTLVEAWDGTSWTIQPSVNQEGKKGNLLNAVSCSSTVACTAVGQAREFVSSGASAGVAQRWDGSKWSSQSTPTLPAVTESAFEDVSCASGTFCMAVGNSASEKGNLENWPAGFSASWNGAEWQLRSSNLSSRLDGVSCSSASLCRSAGGTSGQRWDGSGWTGADFALPPGGDNTLVSDVSCVSSTACVGVGEYYGPRWDPGLQPLAERLTPPWSSQSTPTLPAVTESAFEDVSCASGTMCVGIGNANKGGSTLDNWPNGFTEQWDGTKWTLWPGASAGSLRGVACAPSTSFCLGVGQKTYDGGSLAERWNGSGWALQSTPDPSGATQVVLEDASCTSETACTAVGRYYDASTGYKPLVERWNGSVWSIQTAPSPSGAEGSSGKLLSVSCTSSTSCMAVGRKNDQYGSLRPFAERWDGTAWSIVAAPNPSGESELQDVSCASAGSCMAVGWLQEGTTRKALTARWNGSSWSIVSTPTPSGAKGPVELRGVSCASASSCMAVGRYYSDANFNPSKQETKTLVEAWDGTSWTIQPSVNQEGKKGNLLNAVSCSSTVACTAVGQAREFVSSGASAGVAQRYE
jgi:subtilisin family serine protease